MKSRGRNTGGRAPIAGCFLQAVAILVVAGCTLETPVEPEAATESSQGAVEPGQEEVEAPSATSVGVQGYPTQGVIMACRRRPTQPSGRSPLIIVDGARYDSIRFDVLAALDIESMEVIKAAHAAEVYGEDGKNGVIVFVTRQSGGDGQQDGLPGEPSDQRRATGSAQPGPGARQPAR